MYAYADQNFLITCADTPEWREAVIQARDQNKVTLVVSSWHFYEFGNYATVSLKVAMHINCAVNEMRSIEQEDSIKPVSRSKRRRYDDLSRVLATYDLSGWGDVLTVGIPQSEAISKVFPS
jgi:hypothetical protein